MILITSCGEDTTGGGRDGLLIGRYKAAHASRLRPDLARILLRDATGVVVVFSSLAGSYASSNNEWLAIARLFDCSSNVIAL